METKKCSKCGRELPKSEFYRNPHTKDGLQSWCRACSNKQSTESHKVEVIINGEVKRFTSMTKASKELGISRDILRRRNKLGDISWKII